MTSVLQLLCIDQMVDVGDCITNLFENLSILLSNSEQGMDNQELSQRVSSFLKYVIM